VPGTKGNAALFGDVGAFSGLNFSFFQISRGSCFGTWLDQAFSANAVG
jgi:hypothetical protein